MKAAPPMADIYEDTVAPGGAQALQTSDGTSAPELVRASLKRWHLPGAERMPESRGWFAQVGLRGERRGGRRRQIGGWGVACRRHGEDA
eukprot:351937-Chlamydomonas_euryale.AAC.14